MKTVDRRQLVKQHHKMSGDSSVCSTTTGAAQQLFTSAVNFFAASQCFITTDTNPQYGVPDLDTYDFVIVGAGSAGSVVANRLSEISDWNILLLEAGSEPPLESDIPYMDATMYRTNVDWQYVADGDGVTRQAFKSDSVAWTRGKMLGGCSSINAMIYVKGRDCDYDAWAAQGNPSWSSENVAGYFKKAENLQDMELNEDPSIYAEYGHDGPLIINSYNNTITELIGNVLNSWDEIGKTKVPDINAATFNPSGLSGAIRVTAANGERQSTYKAYLKPISDRKNLKIVTNAFVTKILINNTQAYGVEVEVNGVKKNFFANREIIISAGTVNTPQLLLLSGIGPQEQLLSKNIPVVVDLPGVGNNLQDHTTIRVPIYGDQPEFEEPTNEKMFDIISYLYNKSGYLSHGSYPGVIAFFSPNESRTCPELQSHFALFWKNSSSIGAFTSPLKDEVAASFLEYISQYSLYIFTLNGLHPNSRGSISLRTADPHDHPQIIPNYLNDEEDIDLAVQGLKTIASLVNTTYFQSINAFIPRINLTQCNDYEFLSDLYWRCYALNFVGTVYHPVGTAKMGPNPEDSVVDNFLKVHGVENLRVIDASVMPLETSGNTNAPTIMIGEYGSDMVKNDNLYA